MRASTSAVRARTWVERLRHQARILSSGVGPVGAGCATLGCGGGGGAGAASGASGSFRPHDVQNEDPAPGAPQWMQKVTGGR